MAGPVLLAQGMKRRRDILAFIKTFSSRNQYAPSVQEIADAVGCTKTAVRHHLDLLRDSGDVTWTEGKYRSLRAL